MTSRLEDLGLEPGMMKCPAHDDNRESLSVGEGDGGKVLLYDFAGCTFYEVIKAFGFDRKALGQPRKTVDVATYVYLDEDRKPLMRVTRTEPKGFTQERWDESSGTFRPKLINCRRVPYRLPDWKDRQFVYLVEGEKDVERLWQEALPATTVPGGAQGWRDEYAIYFKGKSVQIIADNDEPGIKGALHVKQALRGVANDVTVVVSPVGKDVTDLYNAGKNVDALVRYVSSGTDVFGPIDWTTYEAEKSEWLLEPYVPRGSRVMAYGPAGSLKSLWAMWLGVKLAKEGHKVAYFSLEMRPSETAKRLKALVAPADTFHWYSRFSFNDPSHLEAACEMFHGYSLIVIDSWSAVSQAEGRTANSNDAVAKLDAEVFQPMIEETGATILILDNTGHPMLSEGGPIKTTWARGASAKGDKMDITLQFDRPDERDNYRTTITVRKMRLDKAIPKPLTVYTEPNAIEFFVPSRQDDVPDKPLWRYDPGAPQGYEREETVSVGDLLAYARDRKKAMEGSG